MAEFMLKLDIEILKFAVVTLALFILYKYHRIFEITLPPSLLRKGAVVTLVLWLSFLADVVNDVYPTEFTKILDDIIISFALILGTYYLVDYMRKVRVRIVPSRVFNGDPTLARGTHIVTDTDVSNVLKLIRGKKAIALTRNPESFKEIGVPYLWLSKVPSENAIDPLRLPAILHKLIENADKDTVVIVEGLEYLVLENGFNSVMKFLTTLKDNLLVKGATLVVIVDPRALEPSQMAVLRREFSELRPEMVNKQKA
ncbi:DUF835 domain-containing protein [Thermococcus peptonophilus]|uniref:DUF835 domain-containing protein n=1 Tax=Thermococcus peptonophilus TaxID=53952 RepID=A0A142CVM4_9EURY|nr:DUF835 domain-containing protein [Thermococcus peptonophilus]AMQ18826.1 hypothetical protein A0127_06380 [Thermococcus peptonophilus]